MVSQSGEACGGRGPGSRVRLRGKWAGGMEDLVQVFHLTRPVVYIVHGLVGVRIEDGVTRVRTVRARILRSEVQGACAD